MRLPIVSRRRHDAETDALRAQVERLRDERDRALKAANTWHGTASRTSELFTDTSIVNEFLTRDLTAAHEQIAVLQAQLSDSAAAQWRAQARREKKRADQLQRRYDDAVGLNTARGDVGLHDSEHWKPPVSLDARPKGGVS